MLNWDLLPLSASQVIWSAVSYPNLAVSGQAFLRQFTSAIVLKPLSHWDATSLRWVCESIRQTVANCRETFACIANSSRTGRQSFKHVILFCATKIIAKPSPSHRICREPVANTSPTLHRRSQTHRKEVSANCTMRQICDINKTISRLNCEK